MLMDIKELHRSEKSVVTLVIDPDTGTRYVRKQLQGSHPVYAQLQAISHPYLPNIIQLEQQADGVTLLEEYIDGASLAEITLPEKQVIALMKNCARCWYSCMDTGFFTGISNPPICCWPRMGISG